MTEPPKGTYLGEEVTSFPGWDIPRPWPGSWVLTVLTDTEPSLASSFSLEAGVRELRSRKILGQGLGVWHFSQEIAAWAVV